MFWDFGNPVKASVCVSFLSFLVFSLWLLAIILLWRIRVRHLCDKRNQTECTIEVFRAVVAMFFLLMHLSGLLPIYYISYKSLCIIKLLVHHRCSLGKQLHSCFSTWTGMKELKCSQQCSDFLKVLLGVTDKLQT